MTEPLELTRVDIDGRLALTCPDVGLFTCAAPKGAALLPGQPAGVLVRLGRRTDLVVPAGVAGLVSADPRPEVQAPVSAGDVLYLLEPLEGAGVQLTDDAAADTTAGLVLRAPQTGRFYHRPAPSDPAFAEAGSIVEEGNPIGLIEVMKTFTHVPYRPAGGLPARARITRMLVADGEDVDEGQPLIEVESA